MNKEDNIRNFRQGKGKFFLKRNRWNFCVLAVILLVGCFFISRKQGYHMDELLSFELANAEFTPWIVTTQPEGRLEKFVKNEIYGENFGETFANICENVKDVLKNRGSSKMLSYKADIYDEPVWITSGQFRDYITTQGRDRFHYLSVYFNVKDDNHPPLHFMALHTVSSLFPGEISPWMGCSINLVLILGICIFLIKISREFLRQSEEFGCAVCILYACSMGGIATLLLIRMYAMLTFFCMAALYLHLKKKKGGQWETHNKLLILVTVCGFLTQYYFVIYMLFLAGVTVVYLWKTEKKKVLYYIRTMGISAVLGLCIFPFSIADVLYSERGVESVQNLGGISGLGERLLAFMRIIEEQALGGVAGIGILLLMAAAVFVTWLFVRERQDVEAAKVREKEMIFIPCVGYFLIVAKIAPYYIDRYIMPLFPLLALLAAFILQKSLDYLQKYLKSFGSKGILCMLAVLVVAPNLVSTAPVYLYEGYAMQESMSQEYADRACLCVYEGVGYYQNLVEFTNYKETLMVTEEELFTRAPDEILEKEEELVVLMKNNIDQAAVEEYLLKEYGYMPGEYLMRNSVHQDTLRLFQKN